MGKRKLAQVGQEAVERLDLPPEVAVAGGSLTVRITGTELQLAAMTAEELRLTGRIKQVELME